MIGMISRKSNGVAWGDGWHFPVPTLITADGQEYKAVITSGVRHPLRPAHHGADIFYKRKHPGDRPEYRAGTPDADAHHFNPEGQPILAARAGKIWSVGRTAKGRSVVIDHGKPWATFYQHLHEVRVRKGDTVKAGDMIGTAGYSLEDKARLRHLHFECWYQGVGNAATQDMAPVIGTWGRSVWRI